MKKVSKILSLLLCFCIAVFFVTAQTPDPATAETTGGIIGWVKNHYLEFFGIVYGIYEVIVRYVPTVKSYSLVSLIIKIIQALVPNKSKDGGTHE